MQLRVGLMQLPWTGGDRARAMAQVEEAAARLAGQGADVVLMPEMYLYHWVPRPEMLAAAEGPEGPTVRRLADLCRRHNVAVVAGLVGRGDGGRVHNVAACVDRRGELRAWYAKTHLWDQEGRSVDPGDSLCTFDLDGIRAGLLICYDIEFPEPARALAAAGVQLLLVPSANMHPWRHYHRTFITARALENHVYVAYCNTIGRTPQVEFVGDSAVIDPSGDVILDLAQSEGTGLALVDTDRIAHSQRVFNYLRRRRPSLPIAP